jgi:phosphoribosylanthranilate isomerase
VQTAGDIAKRLPPEILTVGVFRDEAPQRVVEMVHQAGLGAAQLHGHESSPGDQMGPGSVAPW